MPGTFNHHNHRAVDKYPALKMIPVEVNEIRGGPKAAQKLVHSRRSRQWRKRDLKKILNEEMY